MKRVLLLVALCALDVARKTSARCPRRTSQFASSRPGAVTGQLLSTQPIVEVRNATNHA